MKTRKYKHLEAFKNTVVSVSSGERSESLEAVSSANAKIGGLDTISLMLSIHTGHQCRYSGMLQNVNVGMRQ